LTSHRQIPTFTSRPGGLSLAEAYRVTPLLRAAFEARGEKITGHKIGFTNRKMWKVYGVEAPNWGYTTDHTTHELAHTRVQRVKDFIEPRIEAEIMFGLKSAPLPDMNEAALLDCIEWVSLGYEIVQSIFPEWKFAAPIRSPQMAYTERYWLGPATQLHHARQNGGMNWQRSRSNFVATEN
jgi:2-oxo-3-hexenedioate decarboxylase